MTRAAIVVDEPRTATPTAATCSGIRRLGAWLIDYFLVAVWLGIVFFVAFVVTGGSLDIPGLSSPASRQLVSALLLMLPVLCYFAAAEASAWQGTIGKRATRLVVTDTALQRITIGRSVLRSSLKFLPWELCDTFIHRLPKTGDVPWTTWAFLIAAVLLLAVYVAGLFIGSRRPVYDVLSGTRVVAVR
jgi:uncharacterized RDD family membrane protein YckC